LEQIWQYQRRRCRPLAFIWLATYFVLPTSALGMVGDWRRVFGDVAT